MTSDRHYSLCVRVCVCVYLCVRACVTRAAVHVRTTPFDGTPCMCHSVQLHHGPDLDQTALLAAVWLLFGHGTHCTHTAVLVRRAQVLPAAIVHVLLLQASVNIGGGNVASAGPARCGCCVNPFRRSQCPVDDALEVEYHLGAVAVAGTRSAAV